MGSCLGEINRAHALSLSLLIWFDTPSPTTSSSAGGPSDQDERMEPLRRNRIAWPNSPTPHRCQAGGPIGTHLPFHDYVPRSQAASRGIADTNADPVSIFRRIGNWLMSMVGVAAGALCGAATPSLIVTVHPKPSVFGTPARSPHTASHFPPQSTTCGWLPLPGQRKLVKSELRSTLANPCP